MATEFYVFFHIFVLLFSTQLTTLEYWCIFIDVSKTNQIQSEGFVGKTERKEKGAQ